MLFTSNNEMHQKVKTSTTSHIREPSCLNSCNVCHLLSLSYEKASFSNGSISNDGETCSRPDANEADGDDFDEEEGKDSASGIFLEGEEDLDSVVSVEMEEVSIDVPIMREESTDSMRPVS